MATRAAEDNICGQIYVKDGKLKLNTNEKTLVCGSDKGSDAWKEIPFPQAEFHLKAIVLNLGYLNPRFDRTVDRLNVWLGGRSEFKSLQVVGATGVLDPSRKRKIIGEPLIPENINAVEAWANFGIRSQGYACPQLKLEAHAWDGALQVVADLGGVKKYAPLQHDDMDALNADILDRYQPFETGQIYDIRETQIMADRMLADGLFQSAYFVTKCEADQANLYLKTSVGKPKIFRFGVGASTEELPFLDFTFKNARLDNKASSFTLTLHASPRIESLAGTSELYFFPGWHRTFFGPRFRLAHENEDSYETNSAKAGADIGRNWDEWGLRFSGRWGPTMNYVKTLRGIGPDNASYPTIDGSMSMMSHNYESSIRDQFEGWSSNIFYRGQGKGLGSKVDVNRYEMQIKHLWNMGAYGPPLFVLGSRIDAVTVDANEIEEGKESFDLIPIDERVYLGGDQDLRGFPRKSINNEQLGYLSSLYLGFELRLVEELPYHLQPFLLWDSARLGNRRYTLEGATFISEGLGLRWASPFGTLRVSAAQGRILNQDQTRESAPDKFVFFFSFGQEF